MDFRVIINLALLMTLGYQTAGKLIMKPSDTDVKLNHSAYLYCSTDLGPTAIVWYHGNKSVYNGNAILEPYHKRFEIDMNAWNGKYRYNLVIHSVQPGDAGEYICAEDEGVGDEYSVQLIVLEGDPICRSNKELDVVIGQNTCNIEPDEVELECNVAYHGDIPPQLEWKKVGENCSTPLQAAVTTSSNYFASTLKLKGDIALNNSSYVCETRRTTDKPNRCTSKVIQILYALSDNSTVNKTIGDEVQCNANTSQSCNYTWKWLGDNDFTIESSTPVLKARKPGWHTCEAHCHLGNETCNLLVMQAMVSGETESNSTTPIIISVAVTVFVIGLLVVFVVLIFVLRRIRKTKAHATENSYVPKEEVELLERRHPARATENSDVSKEEVELLESRHPVHATGNYDVSKEDVELSERRHPDELHEKYESEPVLVETMSTKAAEAGKKSITGLTTFDEELFVVTEDSAEIEVYDSIELSFSRRMNLQELFDPQDIVSCHRNKCLYIFDLKGYIVRSREILRVDPRGNLVKNWSTGNDFGQLSVTDESNVLLTVHGEEKLNEYSPDGQLIREITLSSDGGIRSPWHAIRLTNGHFVVSHGLYLGDLHRLCIVDADGKLMKSFCEKRGSNSGQMNRPVYLSVDGNGFVFVVDKVNSRVLLFDSNLEFKRRFLFKANDESKRLPWRILLDKSCSRMLMVGNACGIAGLISVYQFC